MGPRWEQIYEWPMSRRHLPYAHLLQLPQLYHQPDLNQKSAGRMTNLPPTNGIIAEGR